MHMDVLFFEANRISDQAAIISDKIEALRSEISYTLSKLDVSVDDVLSAHSK